jgi:hypothetical protein
MIWPINGARTILPASHDAIPKNKEKEMMVKTPMTEGIKEDALHEEGQANRAVWLMVHEEHAMVIGAHDEQIGSQNLSQLEVEFGDISSKMEERDLGGMAC